MAGGKAVVFRHFSRAEAGAAEAGLKFRPALKQALLYAVGYKLYVDGYARRIYRQGEAPAAHAAAFEYGRGLGDVVVHAAGAAGDHALVEHESAVLYLVGEPYVSA